MIERLKELGYTQQMIIDILINTEKNNGNLIKLIELLKIKEEENKKKK